MRISKLTLLYLAAILSACSSGVQKQDSSNASSATFLVDQPVSATVDSSTSNAVYKSIATEKLFNFTACVKDIAVTEPIISIPFAIRDEKGELIRTQTTDARGCLYWSEAIPYNSLAAETYIQVTRSIEALRVHKGVQTLSLAIDPWKTGGDALLDLRSQSVPKLADAKLAQKSIGGKSSLVIEGIQANLEITKTNAASVESTLRLTMQPKVRRMGLDGNSSTEVLSRGQFHIRYQITARNNGENIALSKVQELNTDFDQGLLNTEQNITIERKPNKENLVEINFSIEPVNAPAGMRTVEGTISLGKFTSEVLSANPIFRENAFTELALVKEENTNAANASNKDMDYVLGKVQIERVLVTETSQNSGRPTKLQINYKACLKNSISDQPILSQNFTLTVDGSSRNLSTDSDQGCLYWQEILPFQYMEQEHYIKRELNLKSNDGFYAGSEKKASIYINPWQYENIGLFLVDDRFAPAPTSLAANNSVNPAGGAIGGAELVVTGLAANFVGRDFDIDNQLNLSTNRKFRLELHPMIRRMTAQGWKEEGIGNGRYHLQVALEPMDSSDKTVIAYQSLEVEANSDTIIASIALRFNDLRSIFARNNIVLLLTPVEKNSGLTTKTYMGAFEPLASGAWLRLEPRTEALRAAKKSSVAGLSGSAVFQRAMNMDSIAARDLLRIKFSDADLEQMLTLKNSNQSLAKLCGYFFANASTQSSCSSSPERYLNTMITEHIAKIRKKPELTSLDSLGLSLSTSFSVNDYESDDTTKGSTNSIAVNAFSGLKVDFLKFLEVGFGVSVGKSWFHTTSHTNGKSKNGNISFANSRNLTADEVDFSINADTNKCLSIYATNGTTTKKPALLCSKKITNKTLQENYYVIYMNYSASPLLDAASSLAERPWTILIRGKDRYENFARLVQDSSTSLSIVKGSPIPAAFLKDAQNKYDGYFPGLLSIQ